MRYFNTIGFEENLLQARYAYDSSSRVEYIGYADPGEAENALSWVIIKYTYNSSNLAIKKVFANGSKAFKLAWSDREGYSYA